MSVVANLFFSFWDIVTMSRVFLGHCQGYLWDVSTPLLPLSSKMLGKTHVRRLFWSSTTTAASQRSEVKIFIKFPMTPASQASGSSYLSSPLLVKIPPVLGDISHLTSTTISDLYGPSPTPPPDEAIATTSWVFQISCQLLLSFSNICSSTEITVKPGYFQFIARLGLHQDVVRGHLVRLHLLWKGIF